MAELAETGASFRGARLRLSAALWRRPWLKLALLLALPVVAFAVVYLGSLASLFIWAFWEVDAFTGKVVHHWTFSNFSSLYHESVYREIALRTLWMAAAVTATDIVLAFPLAYFMARVAPPRLRALLFVAVLLPLWSSYLVRIYAWRTILAKDGALNWALNGIGLPDAGLAYTNTAMWIVFSYVSLPGIVAGSIFTFSLTLGDFITPALVGGAGSAFIGNIVEEYIGINGNVPFAAAFATVPVVVMAIYLIIARRLGAFEAVWLET